MNSLTANRPSSSVAQFVVVHEAGAMGEASLPIGFFPFGPW